MPQHRLLIDTDPGVDDALAILMAHAHPDARIEALTIAAGNVGLVHTVANALKLCEVAGIDAPVFAGCTTPLVHAAEDASYVHGRDGFGDTGYTPAARAPHDEHAALAMLRLSREAPGALTFVMLGPLTNLALALRLDPSLPSRVKRLVIMGGAVTGRGNTRIPVEFNIGFDPEAARIVFEAWPAFELVDWEATLRHGIAHDTFDAWVAGDDPRARFYDGISRQTRAWSAARRGEQWHSADGLAMAAVLEPDGVVERHERAAFVELDGVLTRGATVIDWDRRSERAANATIVTHYDRARFETMIRAALGVRNA
ncbi:nucleoside hydrolase [Chiayiivirga flava]|uniref:Purine nucleosidase n=1 Tax=Chiayiivirga flava TaxID=659595 RepID=A0A7W8D7D8_9GAMM|nr:nucleoside hydrolase [Chiayiivirga flava]MBB5209321.1 purine nucleosidase [Chiayiivirga flava]